MSKFLEWGDTFIRKSRIYRIDLEADESWGGCSFIKSAREFDGRKLNIVNWYREGWESRYSSSELAVYKTKMQAVLDVISPLKEQCINAYKDFKQKLEDASKLPNGGIKKISGFENWKWHGYQISERILNGIASDNKTDEAISEGYIEKDFPEYLDEFKRLRDYFEQNILAINGATGDFVMSIRDLRLRWRVVFYTEEPDVEDRKQKYIGFWGSHEDAVREWRELAETL